MLRGGRGSARTKKLGCPVGIGRSDSRGKSRVRSASGVRGGARGPAIPDNACVSMYRSSRGVEFSDGVH
jgi:hypothetical protein